MAEADDKKDDKKSSPDPITDIMGILILIAIGLAAFGAIGGGGGLFGGGTAVGGFFDLYILPAFLTLKSLFIIFSTVLSVFFIVGIIYASTRYSWIVFEWRKQVYPEPEPEEKPEEPRNARWDEVIAHIRSENPSDWRLAILEADIILDDLLDRLGYVGDTIGDKLKIVNKDRFRSIDAAWEAHRIRNAIAHEGQDFVLTHREAERIIGLFERVFREFDFI